ncbi:hypothetical protein GGF46_004253 [Coemansia sp. RSA 552]|nr:hypothetical protein GGF46_004253 [Coemansia sp. RSA 552]
MSRTFTDTRSLDTPTTGPTLFDDADSPAPEPLCTASETPCSAEDEIPVLVGSGESCAWECQADPLYKEPVNNKGPIIGGSLGATVFVLSVLIALLLYVQCKKRKREQAAYLRDTEDLASELSGEPLLKYMDPVHPVPNSNSSGLRGAETLGFDSSSDGSNTGTKFALFFGRHRSGSRTHADLAAPFVVKAPSPEDLGTELTMDVVDRPPESDPTLAIGDGTIPYRQEKTATAYPLLTRFSNPPDPSTEMGQLFGYTDATPPLAHMGGKNPRKLSTYSGIGSDMPEYRARMEYEAARSSGDAAIAAAARHSAMMSPATAAFDPFNAIPSVHSSPSGKGTQSVLSRQPSDGTSRHLH